MTVIPAIVPPLPRPSRFRRNLTPHVAFDWASAGWRDLWRSPLASLVYGIAVFLVSVAVVVGLFKLGWDYILFPALAGFMVVGPALAVGLYEKSRRLQTGEPVTLARTLFARPKAAGQTLIVGLVLCLLMLVWIRAAVLIYALFFGMLPFPGLAHIAPMLFGTPIGWLMLIVGSAVGALFAAFSFAISAFSIPRLLDEPIDALTAMGTSLALVWHNLPVMLTWGAIILALFVFSLLTGLMGLVIVFPVLGHGTWHAYCAICRTGPSPEG
jgi:uncharacterized membrane protein